MFDAATTSAAFAQIICSRICLYLKNSNAVRLSICPAAKIKALCLGIMPFLDADANAFGPAMWLGWKLGRAVILIAQRLA
jgi:hypothetical protein